jgi:carbon starvation protein CstA
VGKYKLRKIPMEKTFGRSLALYAILVWMIINAIFMLLEVTAFNDAVDPNNSILLILWIASIAGLVLMRKAGAAIATFTLIYAFAFNAFNVLYYSIYLLNGTSAIINAVAIVYMFISIFSNRYK